MKQIQIDYTYYEMDVNTLNQINKAELCHKEILQKRPFEGHTLQMVKDFYKIDLTWSSSALEGNSYTISETKVLLEDGITVAGKPLRHTLEICGHADAYEYMFSLLRKSHIDVSDIKTMHRYLMQKEIGVEAGVYKTEENLITGSDYTTISVNQVEHEMHKLDLWLKQGRGKMHPIQFAAEAHRKLVYIHPFSDGNGRTARLVMNALLIQQGYLPCIIAPVIRLDYIQCLEAGRNGRYNEFIKFIAEAETETEKDFIRGMHMHMPDFSKAVVDPQDVSSMKSEARQDRLGMDMER